MLLNVKSPPAIKVDTTSAEIFFCGWHGGAAVSTRVSRWKVLSLALDFCLWDLC